MVVMRKLRLFGTLAFGLFAAKACNDDSKGETDATQRTPVSPAVHQLLQMACDLSLHCCSRGEVDWYLGPYVDANSCADRMFDLATRSHAATLDLASVAGLSDVALLFPNLAALDQAAEEGRVILDEEAFAACRSHLTDLGCNEPEQAAEGCQPLPPLPEESPCDARRLFVGQLAEGETCTSMDGLSLECAPGHVCGVGVGLGVTGRCVVVKQEGETCSSQEECDDGLYCSALDGTCQQRRQEGEVCVFADRDHPNPPAETLLVRCEPHLSCDPITNTCVARCQPGARCIGNDECDEAQGLACIVGRCDMPRSKGLPCIADDDCEEGLHCGPDMFDPNAFVCTGPKPDHAECAAHDECESQFCSPQSLQCSPRAAVGNPCPSGDGAECEEGACAPEQPLSWCTGPVDCPLTGECDLVTGQCGTYCVAGKQDGATCEADSECTSGGCVAGFCRTRPLGLGVGCDDASDCESEFCGYDTPRVCAELPLGLGSPCFANEECASGVCFPNTLTGIPECISGLDAGELCGEADRPPCNPNRTYCDHDRAPAVCAPLKETGESCKAAGECRGDCTIRHGRQLCAPAAPEGVAICDGSDPTAIRPATPADEDDIETDEEDTDA
jgi:hypothetical protein